MKPMGPKPRDWGNPVTEPTLDEVVKTCISGIQGVDIPDCAEVSRVVKDDLSWCGDQMVSASSAKNSLNVIPVGVVKGNLVFFEADPDPPVPERHPQVAPSGSTIEWPSISIDTRSRTVTVGGHDFPCDEARDRALLRLKLAQRVLEACYVIDQENPK